MLPVLDPAAGAPLDDSGGPSLARYNRGRLCIRPQAGNGYAAGQITSMASPFAELAQSTGCLATICWERENRDAERKTKRETVQGSLAAALVFFIAWRFFNRMADLTEGLARNVFKKLFTRNEETAQ